MYAQEHSFRGRCIWIPPHYNTNPILASQMLTPRFANTFVYLFVGIQPEKTYSTSCWEGSKPSGSGHWHKRAEAQTATCLPKTAAQITYLTIYRTCQSNVNNFSKTHLTTHRDIFLKISFATKHMVVCPRSACIFTKSFFSENFFVQICFSLVLFSIFFFAKLVGVLSRNATLTRLDFNLVTYFARKPGWARAQ